MIERDGRELLFGERRQEARQYGKDDRLAVGVRCGMTIMQEQDVAGSEILRQTGVDRIRVTTAGVVGAPRPCRKIEVQAGQHRVKEGIA